MAQSWIMSRLRIKCFLLESWVDCQFELIPGDPLESSESIPWKAAWVMSRSEPIPGDPLESWVDSEPFPWKATWVMSWIDSTLRDTVWVLSWFESISWKTFETKAPKRSHQMKLNGASPKNHIKPNPMGHRPNHNGIIESLVDSNQYSRKFLSRESIWIKIMESLLSRELIWIKTLESFLSRESIWIEALESHLGRESIWIEFQKPFWDMSWSESILEI